MSTAVFHCYYNVPLRQLTRNAVVNLTTMHFTVPHCILRHGLFSFRASWVVIHAKTLRRNIIRIYVSAEVYSGVMEPLKILRSENIYCLISTVSR